MFHADRRTHEHVDMTKLIVAFRNSAKAIKKGLKTFIFPAVYYVEMQGATVFRVFVCFHF
jgi:molybdopterin biosynthesis enzyme MoaB